jgi:antitoxin ParD1/3/4
LRQFEFNKIFPYGQGTREKESYRVRPNTISSELSILKLITVKLPEAILEGLNELVKAGMYQNRSAAIRAAVRDMLKKELWRTEEN